MGLHLLKISRCKFLLYTWGGRRGEVKSILFFFFNHQINHVAYPPSNLDSKMLYIGKFTLNGTSMACTVTLFHIAKHILVHQLLWTHCTKLRGHFLMIESF